ncbi:GntR family transcriptional regulator [Cytobacillus horneckiae]|uniref:GntR family transcriptional regulator n=1 Tax=Cytobacillus horneckiae TaxID=549687 RepID=UPI003D9A55EF
MQGGKEAVIVDAVMQMIREKKLIPGEKLPSENELAEEFTAPRITVRKALQQLEARGHVYTIKGKGRFLKEEAKPIHLHLTGSESFTDKMTEAGYNLKTVNISCQKEPLRSPIYQKLEGNVYKVSRLRLIENEPMAIHQSYVSELAFPDIDRDGPSISSMFAYYRKHGYKEFTSNGTYLCVRFPTSEEQKRLNCNSMIPLIVLESNTIDCESGKILEFNEIIYRSDKFKYDMTR